MEVPASGTAPFPPPFLLLRKWEATGKQAGDVSIGGGIREEQS